MFNYIVAMCVSSSPRPHRGRRKHKPSVIATMQRPTTDADADSRAAGFLSYARAWPWYPNTLKYTEKTLAFIEFVPSSLYCIWIMHDMRARVWQPSTWVLDSIRPGPRRKASESAPRAHSEFFEKLWFSVAQFFAKKSLCPGVGAKRHARTSHICTALVRHLKHNRRSRSPKLNIIFRMALQWVILTTLFS